MSIQSLSASRSQAVHTSLLVAFLVFVGLASFSGALLELVNRWSRQEEYSHGFIIPLVVLGLLWARRDALLASMGRPAWSGPILVLVAAFMQVLGELSAIFILSQVGFVIALIGITLGVGGYSLLRVAFIPIVFLLFAIPLPYFIDSVLSLRLQFISSELGVLFIRMFQVPVYLEGNVIDLGTYKLQVVEACSGLRYLYPLLSLGFLAAYMFQAPLWQRALVLLSTIPITIVMNSFRIGVVGLLVDRWGTQMAEGMIHFFEGWVIFLACAALLALEMYLLALASGKKFFQVFYFPKVEPSLPGGAETGSVNRTPAVACLAVLCVAGLAAFFVSGRQEIRPDRTRFVSFPSSLGQWQGRPSLLDVQVEHFLGLEDYILSDYSKPRGGAVNLYVAYYGSQRKGSSPHSPIVCIPGGGWQITQFDRTSYSNEALGLNLPFNRVVIERGTNKQLVYYWFEGRGRKIANEYWSKWYLLADSIMLNRSDGALVRLTTPLSPGENERDGDERLRLFIHDLEPSLRGYLPPATHPDVKSAVHRPSGGQT